MQCIELGSGSTPRKEPWITTDLNPQSGASMVLDVTKRFPFEDNSIDYVYSEHMIEHIPLIDGEYMLRECYRVLKPNGYCRIVTPSIKFLDDILHDPSLKMEEYRRWASSAFGLGDYDPRTIRSRVFNNFVRAWGHQFIYDHGTLWATMEDAGFRSLDWKNISESNHPVLRNLETVHRLPAGFLAMESMIIEGCKN